MSGFVTRRSLLAGISLFGAGTGLGLSLGPLPETVTDHHGFLKMKPTTADEALDRLIAGNKCYMSEHFDVANARRTNSRREEVVVAQRPYAIILSCADSRVSPDIVFTAGLGDLFVVRVAGNIVSPQCLGTLGSIEYAVQELKVPLVFVLGHESCGAVKAALEYVKNGSRPPSAIGIIVDAIRPAIEGVARRGASLLDDAVEANVEQSVKALIDSHEIIAPAVLSQRLAVVGGVYELSSGNVRVLGGLERAVNS